MNVLDKYRILDDKVFEEFKKYFPKTTNSTFNKEFPNTSILISMFDTSATFIKNSIFDCCETDNNYAVKILFRSLIEHFFRFKYIFMNWAKTKSDSFAKNYMEYGKAKETLEMFKSQVSEQQLFEPKFKIKIWDIFLKDNPRFGNKTRKEIDDELKKLSFNSIMKFLNKELYRDNDETSTFFGKLIKEYSKSSSYVHGGMRSYKEMGENNNTDYRDNEYNRISGLTCQMSNSIKLFTLIMYVQTDKALFNKHYQKIDKIITKINKV